MRLTRTPGTLALRLLATVMLLLGTIPTAEASSTAQEEANGGPWSMGILARLDGPASSGNPAGIRFVVTTTDGGYVGECVLAETDRWGCRVDVPSDRVSLVWEDLDSIPAGYAPVENPVVFDPATYETGPHNIGAGFQNVWVDRHGGNGVNVPSFLDGPVRDVIIVPFDTRNDTAVNGRCARINGVTAVACDDDRDGRIAFFDVPVGGPYTICIPNLGVNMFLARAGHRIVVEPGREPLVFEAIVGFRSSGSTSDDPALRGC